MAKTDQKPRSCIVTGSKHAPDEMIRFVRDPENRVVPDVRCKLPGRGVWVLAERTRVETAVAKDLFSRGFKARVIAEEALPELVARILRVSALDAIGMAKKAGLVIAGRAKTEAAIRNGFADVLVQATDAAGDGVRKLESALRSAGNVSESPPGLVNVFASAELDQVLGGTNTMHIALQKGGATTRFLELTCKYTRYQGKTLQTQ